MVVGPNLVDLIFAESYRERWQWWHYRRARNKHDPAHRAER
jgi:hypothetical protein